MQGYSYGELKDREIRLLQLKRDPEDNHLQGNILIHNLDEPLRYEALSSSLILRSLILRHHSFSCTLDTF
jgi:hypothetical protein